MGKSKQEVTRRRAEGRPTLGPGAPSLERGRTQGPVGRGLARGDSDRARLLFMVTMTHQPGDSRSDTPTSAPAVDATWSGTNYLATATEAIASAQRREHLLAASAAGSRLLLQSPDVMAVVPKVLQLVGEAADADLVTLLLLQPDSHDHDQLVAVGEWRARGLGEAAGGPQLQQCVSLESWNERHPGLSAELLIGRSVLCYEASAEGDTSGCDAATDADDTKALVPIFVLGEFVGLVGFVSRGKRRAIGAAELSALETAAGVIGAALHRERLVDAVRRERELALVNDKAAVLRKLEQLTGETELGTFLGGHVLLEASERVGAAGGAVIVRDAAQHEWRVLAYMRGGRLEPTPYAGASPLTVEDLFGTDVPSETGNRKWVPTYFDLADGVETKWPRIVEHHGRLGDTGVLVFPLVFGESLVGFMVLTFKRPVEQQLRESEVLVGLAHAATIAIEFARRTDAARDGAVLVERNRIAQEIHDGIAQAFTGILLQLGAVEQPASDAGPHAALLTRIASLAREGLADARRSVMALRPAPANCRGLESALRELAARSTIPGGITTTLDGSGWAARFTPEHEHELLRIAQEAVSNAVRHARPHTIRISMTGDETHWALAVTDDGAGLPEDPETSAQEGFGLTSMRERASAIGAEWSIRSRRGGGTSVVVRIPKEASA
jgi:signal transduction histidine kinase